MIRRDAVLGPLAMVLMTAHGNVFPQPNSGKVWRIGFLSESWPRGPWATYPLTSTGYVEGRDFVFDYKYAQGQRSRLPTLAAELVANKPDVLLGMLNPEIAALKAATTTIPIVMMYASGPVEMGFVSSLARPGGNITGTTTNVPGMAGKMVEVLRDAVPAMKRIAWFNDLSYPGINQYAKSFEDAVNRYGLILQENDVRTRADLDLALASLERQRPDGMGVSMVGVSGERYAQIVDAAARLRIPAIYSTRTPVVDGGLISYAPNFRAMADRNAWQIDRILKGAKPGDLPVEEPARFLLTINMKTAKAIGLNIPQSLLLRADEVI